MDRVTLPVASGESCETCHYWRRFASIAGVGTCHKSAPKPYGSNVNVRPRATSAGLAAWWPETNDTDWCGDWKSKTPAKPPAPARAAILDEPISALGLSVRAQNCIETWVVGDGTDSVKTVGDLIRLTPNHLLGILGFGERSLTAVREKLAAHGIRLRGDVARPPGG